MLSEVSAHIKKTLQSFNTDDALILNNKIIPIDKHNFTPLQTLENKKITFIDGGQAEIISSGNFCLSFIRVAAITLQNNKKIAHQHNEFYLFTKAVWKNNDLIYESTIFPLQESLFNQDVLTISSNDSSIKTGAERAPISKITNMARRFAELSIAKKIQDTDFILLDGTLEPTFKGEEQFLFSLPTTTSALAKSSSLFTTSGNSPVVLLNKIGPQGTWHYDIDNTSFVKLHPSAKHVFRFEGNKGLLPYLIPNASDALFIGYPYGLILVDKLARVSNQEKQSLMMQFLLRAENKEIADYLTTSNAHSILDRLG